MPSLADTCSVVLENIISDEKLLENHVAIFKEEQVLMICQGFFFTLLTYLYPSFIPQCRVLLIHAYKRSFDSIVKLEKK